MNAAGHRAFDVAHYVSVPNLLAYKLTGSWVPWQVPSVEKWIDRWLRPYYESEAPDDGAYIFFACRKH
jgi:hypothetical protein